jgi:cobalt/nickel transport system permease protein
VHIPDGFLSVPVWAALDAAAIPAVTMAARRAQNDLETPAGSRIPLLGVMGAFVFAAQMINFPVGLGTSGHLVGGALLAIAVGPAAASVVLTAILVLQAFVFQDGGIIALGANTVNMAVAGVLAGYLPYRVWGQGSSNENRRSAAMFAGGLLSVMVSGSLALTELLISGVPVPQKLVWLSLVVFLISGALEGAITVTVVHAIEKLNPTWVRSAPVMGSRAVAGFMLAVGALVLAGAGVASAMPDAIQRLAMQSGISAAPVWSNSPLAEYQFVGVGSEWARKASAGIIGLMLIFGVCVLIGRMITRRLTARQRSA